MSTSRGQTGTLCCYIHREHQQCPMSHEHRIPGDSAQACNESHGQCMVSVLYLQLNQLREIGGRDTESPDGSQFPFEPDLSLNPEKTNSKHTPTRNTMYAAFLVNQPHPDPQKDPQIGPPMFPDPLHTSLLIRKSKIEKVDSMQVYQEVR